MSSRPALPRNVWVLGFVSLLMDLSSEIYHALLPAFITIILGLPATALGAIDGVAEATANFAKLASGRLSDRSLKRKPWVLSGYALAALSKPLFPLARGVAELMGARFIDRIGKGLRDSPRDAIIADETAPAIRGRAFGLRQALDTVGALLAPLVAMVLMFVFSNNFRAVFWVGMIPAVASVLLIVIALREPDAKSPVSAKRESVFGGFRQLPAQTRRVLGLGFLFMLARFSESFLILRGMDLGLSPGFSPLALVLFNFGYLALAYPAGALSDRLPPRSVLAVGIAVLVSGDVVLALDFGLPGLIVGILLWGAHMGLTQGIFARMVADSSPEHLRGTSFGAFYFVTGIATLLASLGAGLMWDREGPAATFLTSAAIAATAAAMLSLLREVGTSPQS